MIKKQIRYPLKKPKLEETLNRIRYIFDEFEDVVLCFSGGKDSSVIFELTMTIAKEKNRLPLNVLFIDQEAEWSNTIRVIKNIMYRKDVKPYWLQIPIKLFNATSYEHDWLFCWEEGKEWMRKKDPISIKTNKYGTDRFKKLFKAFMDVDFKDKKVARIGGVRVEESPARSLSLTANLGYKNTTWSNKLEYLFYPIYDWSYTDVWKYINDNNIDYNKVYDYQYRHGVPINHMRVSNLHHETAVESLYYLHEVEPETHKKLLKRLNGVHSAIQIQNGFKLKKLPFMFESWIEYRDYLLEKLIPVDHRRKFLKDFARTDKEFEEFKNFDSIVREECNAIILNDYTGTRVHNIIVRNQTKETIKRYHDKYGDKNGKIKRRNIK